MTLLDYDLLALLAAAVNIAAAIWSEYRQLTEKPAAAPKPARKFKPMRLNVAKFDTAWDRKRGAAVRLMGVLLQEDDATMERRVCENEHSAKTYAEAAAWLQRESAYLRKMARLLETAGGRVAAMVSRCQQGSAAAI